jgi:hypothetical protein
MLDEKLNAKRQVQMTSQLPIVEKTCTLFDETIHIMPECTMHLHGHQNKAMPLMKPYILVDLNNGAKFHGYICWSTNDTPNHHLPCQVSNQHIGNKDLVFLGHVKIGL